MDNPGTLLHQAKLSRRLKTMVVPVQTGFSRLETQPHAPQHRSSHASYTALMHSHDRMRTRHISGQGGGNGAYNASGTDSRGNVQ